MEFGLSASELALQEKARAFAQEFVAPRAAEVDRTGGYPWDIVTALAKAGFCGMTIPEAYGGKGLSYLDAVPVIGEMAKACTVAARVILATHMGDTTSRLGDAKEVGGRTCHRRRQAGDLHHGTRSRQRCPCDDDTS